MVTAAASAGTEGAEPMTAEMTGADQNLDEVQELRKRVEADATDFDAWTQLVSACEKLVSTLTSLAVCRCRKTRRAWLE